MLLILVIDVTFKSKVKYNDPYIQIKAINKWGRGKKKPERG